MDHKRCERGRGWARNLQPLCYYKENSVLGSRKECISLSPERDGAKADAAIDLNKGGNELIERFGGALGEHRPPSLEADNA